MTGHKILFVARAIGGVTGGVERMITTIMNAMVERGHAVHLLTWDAADEPAMFEMSHQIGWTRIKIGNPAERAGIKMRIRRALFVRRFVRSLQPDIAVCFQDGPFRAVRLFTLGMKLPVVAAERNAPTRFKFIRAGKHQWLTYRIMGLAARILVQCPSFVVLYPAFLRDKIDIIPNPVHRVPEAQRSKPIYGEGRKTVLSIGRLEYQKNFQSLVSAFSQIADTHPDWDLVIVGSGAHRGVLEDMISTGGLGARIRLHGSTSDVNNYYCSTEIVCVPSRWEGFPNVLAEGLAHGLPAVGFADCAGVRDLIIDGQNGLLAPGMDDPSSLAHTLSRIMSDDRLRSELSGRAAASVQPYEPARIYGLWESVILDVVQGS